MDKEITENESGVRLHKYYENDEYEIPSIVYDFTSRRREPVSIHIEEEVPEDLDPTHVGFHPGYGREYWEVVGTTLEFDYELSQGGQYRTVIAVVPGSETDTKHLLSESNAFEVTATSGDPEEQSQSAPTAGEGFTRSASSDGGTNDEAMAQSMEIDLDDPTESSENATDESPVRATTDGSGVSPQADSGSIDTTADDSIGDLLAAELESGTLSDEAIRTLRRRLNGDDTATGSVNARLDRLQSDVSNLRAYTSALEEFLDEEGSAEEIIARFDEQLRSFEDDLVAFDEKMASFEGELVSVDEALESVDDRVDEVESHLASVEGDVEAVGDGLTTVQDDLDDLDDLASDVARIERRLPDGDVEARLETLEDDVARASAVIDRIHEAFD